MRPRPGLAMSIVLLLLSAGMGRADDVERGRELAQRLCAVCHLNEGQGEKEGVSGIPGFAAVANRRGQTYLDIVRWLEARPPMMPDHHLSRDEAGALAAYIMSLRKVP